MHGMSPQLIYHLSEKQRLKKKDRESKSLIQRLTADLKREQDRNLGEVTLQAKLKREVSMQMSSVGFA